jgi:hypothetical protein
MFVASNTLPFLVLVGLTVAAALAYFLIPRRPPKPKARAPKAAPPPPGAMPAGDGAGSISGEAPPVTPAQPPMVSVRAVVERMAAVGDDETAFLDPTTNNIITLGDQMRSVLEHDDPLEETLGADQEMLLDLRNKLKAKSLIQLPTKAETNEFAIQERFCDGLPAGEAKEQMFKVLMGHTGFRSFDGAVKRLGIEAEWHVLRDAEFAAVALAWLEKNEIPFVLDVAPAEPPEQEFREAS